MENIYKLSERAARISIAYETAMAALDAEYEENGGEITEKTERMTAELEHLEGLKLEIERDFVRFPDEYAAWYKNVQAQKKVYEAEKKAVEEEQKKVLAHHQARINRLDSTLEWIRENMEAAMNVANVDRFDKKKTGGLFSIYFQNSRSVDVDEDVALQGYRKEIEDLSARLPEWLTLTPKVSKSVVSKYDSLPVGFERKESRTLVIK